MADIGDQSGGSSSADDRADETQPLVERAVKQAGHMYSGVVTIIMGVFAIVLLVVSFPLIIVGLILQKLLPIVGFVAILFGIIGLGLIWIVPGQVIDPVTHSSQLRATGRVILWYFVGGFGAFYLAGFIDRVFERTDGN